MENDTWDKAMKALEESLLYIDTPVNRVQIIMNKLQKMER